MRLRTLGLAALAWALATPAFSVELDRGDLRLELSASTRALYRFTRDLRADYFFETGRTKREDTWGLLSRMRVELEGVWRDQLYGELAYDLEGRTGTELRTLFFDIADEIGTRTWIDADHTFSEHRDFNGRHVLYRAWLRYEADRFDLTVGRQRIPLGRARLWNPPDLFNPIPPLQIQGHQRIGQDSVLARVKLADELWAEFIRSRESDPDLAKTAGRLELVRPEIDAAVMVGRFDHDWVYGLDFARNLRDAAVRGEVTYTDEDGSGHFWQAVLSLDYTFPVGNGLYGLVEQLYNENLGEILLRGSLIPSGGAPAQLPAACLPPAAPPFPPPFPAGRCQDQVIDLLAEAVTPSLDRITTVVRHQTGFQVSYEVNPLVNAGLLWLQDWKGPSSAIVPTLQLSLTDDVVLSGGVQFFWAPKGGDRAAQYDDASSVLFLQIDAYF